MSEPRLSASSQPAAVAMRRGRKERILRLLLALGALSLSQCFHECDTSSSCPACPPEQSEVYGFPLEPGGTWTYVWSRNVVWSGAQDADSDTVFERDTLTLHLAAAESDSGWMALHRILRREGAPAEGEPARTDTILVKADSSGVRVKRPADAAPDLPLFRQGTVMEEVASGGAFSARGLEGTEELLFPRALASEPWSSGGNEHAWGADTSILWQGEEIPCHRIEASRTGKRLFTLYLGEPGIVRKVFAPETSSVAGQTLVLLQSLELLERRVP